jgi:hypothetical protein
MWVGIKCVMERLEIGGVCGVGKILADMFVGIAIPQELLWFCLEINQIWEPNHMGNGKNTKNLE